MESGDGGVLAWLEMRELDVAEGFPRETLIKLRFVIPSEEELPAFGQFPEVEEPAFVVSEPDQRLPKSSCS